MKKLLLLFAAIALVAAVAASPAEAISIGVNGTELTEEAVLINSITYVPLRSLSGLLCPGAKVSWANGAAAVTTPQTSITARAGDLYIQANGRYLYAVDGVRIINSKMYVPVRVLARALGASVSWDSATQRAVVTSGTGTITSGDKFYNSDEVYWLSRIISAESAGEPMKGKIAVGNVILNRVASRDYPNTIYEVIFDDKYGVQFQPTANDTIYDEPTADSIIAAKLCLDGASVAGACRFFFNPVDATSTWISESCTYYATIGNHLFYN